MTAQAPAGPAPSPKPRRSFAGRAATWALRGSVAVAVAVAVLTQSGVLAWLILPRIEGAIGCVAEAGRVSVAPDGHIIIRDLRLIVPGLDSTAATFFQAARVDVTPRWSGLLTGTIPIESIRVVEPILRLSQDRELNLNLEGLRATGAGAAPTFIPAVELSEGILDLGEHEPGSYTPLITIGVKGRLVRDAGSSSRYALELSEVAKHESRGAGAVDPGLLRLEGEFDLGLQTGFVKIDNIDLARWQRVAVPSRVADQWRQLAVTGAVHDIALSYTPMEGGVVSFSLDGVSLNIPVPAESEEDKARARAIGQPVNDGALLAMRGVTGDLRFRRSGIEATLRGLIEGLPCTVRLTTEGYDPALSAITCVIIADRFMLEKQPRFLPFSPFVVKRNVKRFSSPTAEVSGEVTLRRGPAIDGVPAPLSVAGRIDFERGAAAFEKFPYPFSEMKGTILFDESKVEILSITGVAPSGAKLLARGTIAPPNDLGEVAIDVAVADAPIDGALREAVHPARRALLDFLFSEAACADLYASGLARRPGAPGNAPEFELGGVAEILVAVRRVFGDGSEYRANVDVRIPRAGILCKAAPYPAVARDLRLRISDEALVLRAPDLTGLDGARLSLEGVITLHPPGERDEYRLAVTGANVRWDERLLRAIPDRPSPGESDRSARAFVRSLGLAGLFDGRVEVYSREDGSTGYAVHAALAGSSATIGGAGCLEFRDLAGDVIVSDADAHALGLTGRVGGGSFRCDLSADVQGADVAAEAALDRFGLDEPVEALIGLVSREHADRVASMRARFDPRGGVTGTLALRPLGGGTDFRIELRAFDRPSVALLGGRLTVESCAGEATITPREVSSSGFSGSLVFDGAPAGVIVVRGSRPFDERGTGRIEVSLVEGRLESPLVRAAAGEASPRVARWLDELGLAGVFDLDAAAEREAGREAVRGEFRPRSLSLSRRGTTIAFDRVAGTIRFGPKGGEVAGLEAATDRWSVSAGGRWASSPALDIDLMLGFRSSGLPADLLAVLPREAAGALADAKVDVQGSIMLEGATLRTVEEGRAIRLATSLDAGAVAFDVGVPVAFDAARADVTIDWPVEGEAPPRVASVLSVPVFTVSGIPLTDGRVDLHSAGVAGAYDIPSLSALLHGGSVSGWASFRGGAEAAPGRYEGELRAAGVDFASCLNDLRLHADPAATNIDAPESRGRADATITLSGEAGRPGTRRGRGLVRVHGGEVVALPGAMPLLRLSNLQPPVGERLDAASAAFYLAGDRVVFERLEASSPSLVLAGEGSLRLPDLALDIWVNSRGRSTIPILDDILRGLRDEVVSTHVTGTLREPDFRLETFPATQRMLGAIFGAPEPSTRAPASPPGPEPTP